MQNGRARKNLNPGSKYFKGDWQKKKNSLENFVEHKLWNGEQWTTVDYFLAGFQRALKNIIFNWCNNVRKGDKKYFSKYSMEKCRLIVSISHLRRRRSTKVIKKRSSDRNMTFYDKILLSNLNPHISMPTKMMKFPSKGLLSFCISL